MKRTDVEERFLKKNCKVWPIGIIFGTLNNRLNRLFDHGFIVDRACVWHKSKLEGHEIALISRTYLSEEELKIKTPGLKTVKLPKWAAHKDDAGINVATVVTGVSEEAELMLTLCSGIPADMLAYAIPRKMTFTHAVRLDCTACNYPRIKIVKKLGKDADFLRSIPY